MNCSRKGFNFQKFWATKFGKAKIKLKGGGGILAEKQNKTQPTIVNLEKVLRAFNKSGY